jgi:hypothetical protein
MQEGIAQVLPPDSAQTFYNAPIEDLLYILLRQLKRPLDSQGVSLTDADAKQLANQRVNGAMPDMPALLPALVALVDESRNVLAAKGLTFIQSLDTPMDKLPGWQSTAEFLELANEKSNAELRITLGAALALAFGGERHFAPELLHLAEGDYGDESVIARRVLLLAAGIEPDIADPLAALRAWLAKSE